MIVKRIYTRAKSLFFIGALSAATMIIPATAMAALTAQDQANLTASLEV